MSDLGRDAIDLLARGSDGDEPSPADEARVRGKLAAQLGVALGVAVLATTKSAAAAGAGVSAGGATAATAAGVGTSVAPPTLVAAGTSASIAGGLAAKLTVGAVVLGALGGGSAYAVAHSDTARVPPPVVSSYAVPTSPAKRAVPLPSSAFVAIPEPSSVDKAPEIVPSAISSLLPSSPIARAMPAARATDEANETKVEDPLVIELALMHDAQAALGRGDASSALAKVSEHATRFPQGSLTPEREGTRVLALCSAGRNEEARIASKAFLGAYGRSPLAERVRHSCAAESPP